MNMNDRLVLLLILLTRSFSEQLQSNTQPRTIHVCVGHSADLIWEIDEDENNISRLEWYFNKKKIYSSSQTQNVTMNALYRSRIEKIGKTHIRLKNISLEDEGIYILYPLLQWSTSQKMFNISLKVLVPPTTDCTCKISYTQHPPKLTYDLTASYCGRPTMTAIWKRKQTFDILGDRNYILINSLFDDNEILCCPEGIAMKCVADSEQFCKSVSIPREDNEKRSNSGNNTIPSVTQTITGTRNHSNECTNMYWMVLGVLIVSSFQVAILLLLVFIIYKTRRGMRKWG
ncbi:hypothetical protein ACJMK2_026339 [Sinanodonta woodiana]|uniref:Uncharacterized protein n=1 Tax=Sinanodonta woodiana TaxID=1069815 RepID=A0ABD3XJA4_SINWO